MTTLIRTFTPPCAALLLLILSIFGFSAAASAQIFSGTGGGAIPDNNASGVVVNFQVNGLTGPVRTVAVVVDLQHSFAGDLTVQLVSPNGLARLNLFGRVGASATNNFGDSSNLSGIYPFTDSATSDLWATAQGLPNTGVIPSGAAFRTSVAGVPGRGLAGGCSSFLSLAFGGLSAAQANGTWTLRVTDNNPDDTGVVTAATSALFFTLEDKLLSDGFEAGSGSGAPLPVDASSTVGNCTPVISSPTGSGVTDYVLARPLANVWRWIVKVNTPAGDGAVLPSVDFGNVNDDPTFGDFDGDGISDLTVSRNTGVAGARFFVRRSSRPNDVPLDVSFGTGAGQTTRLLADFDGDRITDFTFYKSAAPVLGASGELQIRLSSTGAMKSFAVPNAGNLPVAAMRDVNGDGRADFVHRNAFAIYRAYSGADGALLKSIDFQTTEYSFFPGQVTGSAATDITIYRNKVEPISNTMQKVFQTVDFATGVTSAEFYFPDPVGVGVAPGGYDGDGLVDYAFYRPPGWPVNRASWCAPARPGRCST